MQAPGGVGGVSGGFVLNTAATAPATAAGARGAGVDPGGVAGPLTRGPPGSLGAGAVRAAVGPATADCAPVPTPT